MKCVVVLGTERSCTSAVAGVLHLLGCPMASEEFIIKAHPEFNAKGHFEDRRWHELNRRVSRQLGLHKEQEAEYKALIAACRREPIWGVKDPYFVNMGGLVFSLIEDDLYFIAVHRRFDATVASLQRHHDGGKGTHLVRAQSVGIEWKKRFFDMLHWVSPLYHLQAERLMTDTEQEIQGILNFLGWSPKEDLQKAIDFIDPTLYHFPRLK
ncbi:MAG: hypothetical protein KAY24_00070 [Candidatus Eisenbacteria sp.]|nr:hypothetical protein [Candidatus Eisenbacteria bacterium]